MIHAVDMREKPRSLMGCTNCIYNSMFLNQGNSKVICDNPGIPCDMFREPSAADMRRISWENPEWRKWHDEKEAESRARRFKETGRL